MIKIRNWITTFLGSSPFSALLALAGVFVGSMASVYAQEIKDGSWITWAFLLVCFLFFALFFLRDRIVTAQRTVKEAALEEAKDELVEMIRTMPPINMLAIYGEIYRTVSGLLLDVDELEDTAPEKIERIEGTIRFTLDGICSLIAAFDNYPQGAEYSANFMQFVPTSKLRQDKTYVDVLERLRFVAPKTLDGLAGVLDLIPALSCNTNSGASDIPDNSLVPLALPVPNTQVPEAHGKTRYLPGAPAALEHGSYLIESTADIARYVEDNCDVTPSVAHEVAEYMHQIRTKGTKSWLSIRIGKTECPLGVININSSKTSILKDQKQLYTALSLFVVFQAIIEGLLEKRTECITLQNDGV